ncbi:peroxiredoxin [Sulfobacillus harzensis]|uniref:Peroxiredoxin n=1 Tax=Sulfobacillus harzensis TaxID=2729629 RepID=A0A7Y0L935_9FIRM|nr:peroxiredoxin [Sulfobacillus harzensis]NMP25091.1 peroxiredoxin [Sulfobacillus harzensis]
MALVGHVSPDFSMPAIFPDLKTGVVSLDQYRGQWLVLFFYPHDFTFVCPTEIVAISETYGAFQKLNTAVVGVSTDSTHVHKAWMQRDPNDGGIGRLAYPLASDGTHEVSRRYQVYVPQEGAAYRGLFIINPEGQVEYEVVHNLNVGRSVDEVLRVLQGLQSGGLCPVNWHAGDKLLEAY